MSGGAGGLVAIIADDVTGALDTAAPFAARGLQTCLLIENGEAWPQAPGAQVLSLALETRHAPPENAQARVAMATAHLRRLGAAVLLKKIDSTLRGNVAAETVACLRASGRAHALIAPAVPAHGRILRGGDVLVGGVALRDTPLARDALSPPPLAPLAEVLRAAAPDVAVHALARGALPALDAVAGPSAWLLDCESAEDLDAIARCGLAQRDRILFVGASGLGASLAAAMAAPACAAAPMPQATEGAVLFVVGSRSPRAAAQVAALGAEGGAFVLAPDPSAAGTAAEIAAALGEAAARRVRGGGVKALVLVGGDTALATFRALDIRTASVDGEIMAGIPRGHLVFGPRRVDFVSKAGDFGDADALRRILDAVR